MLFCFMWADCEGAHLVVIRLVLRLCAFYRTALILNSSSYILTYTVNLSSVISSCHLMSNWQALVVSACSFKLQVHKTEPKNTQKSCYFHLVHFHATSLTSIVCLIVHFSKNDPDWCICSHMSNYCRKLS